MIARSEKKAFATPDDSIEVEKGKIKTVRIGALLLAQGEAEPGWRWSANAKPTVKTDLCQRAHHGWVMSGTMKYQMEDGTELEFGPGDAFAIAPGHDAWVVGDESFEYIEIFPGIM